MDIPRVLDVLKRMESKLDCVATQNKELNTEMKEMLVQIAANKCPCQSSPGILSSSSISSSSCNSNIEVDKCIDVLYNEAKATMKTDMQLIKAIDPVDSAKEAVPAVSGPSNSTADATKEKSEKPFDKTAEKVPESSSSSAAAKHRHSLGNIVKEKLMPALRMTPKQTTSKSAVPEVNSKKTDDGDNEGSRYMTLRSGKVKGAAATASSKGPASASTTSQSSSKAVAKKGPKKQISTSSLPPSTPPPSDADSGSSFNRRAAIKKTKSVQQPPQEQPLKSVVFTATNQLIANGAAISPISRFKQAVVTAEELAEGSDLLGTTRTEVNDTANNDGTGDPPERQPLVIDRGGGGQLNIPPNIFDNKVLPISERLKAWEIRSTKKH